MVDSLNTAIKVPQMADKIPIVENQGQYEWLDILLRNNPGLVTILITGLILPLSLIWINNRNARKIKELEKQLDEKYKGKEDIRSQEKTIYASLSKILFDVQQLHVALSGTCVDKNCIDNAVTRFDESITRYHQDISNNMLYMPSNIIDKVYTFYSKISDLKISLKEFNDSKNFEMAHVSVYIYSSELAEILIEIQAVLVDKDEALKKNFDKTKQEMMKYCCGRKPPKELFDKYVDLLKIVQPNISEEEINRTMLRWS